MYNVYSSSRSDGRNNIADFTWVYRPRWASLNVLADPTSSFS